MGSEGTIRSEAAVAFWDSGGLSGAWRGFSLPCLGGGLLTRRAAPGEAGAQAAPSLSLLGGCPALLELLAGSEAALPGPALWAEATCCLCGQ